MVLIEDFKKLVEAEYEWLRQKLGLRRVALEVVMDETGASPGYGGTPRRIVFPVSEADLSIVHELQPTVTGPDDWRIEWWEAWRVLLWHEVAHQVQDQLGFGWNPLDGRRGHAEPSWSRVIDTFAARVGCPNPRVLYKLLASLDTNSYIETEQ